MFFTLLITFVVLLCLADYLINNNSNALLIRKIPGIKYHFFFGNALSIILSPEEIFELGRKMAKKCKGIYSFYAFTVAAVNIYNPEDIEIVTSSMKHHEKSGIYNILTPWLREGLLLSKGSKWQQRRKILTPAFHFNVLRQYHQIFEENNLCLVETLEKTSGNPTNLNSLMSEFTLSTICESAMGTQLNNDGSVKAYKQAIYDIFNIIFQRFIKVYLLPNITYNLSKYGKLQSKYLSVMHEFTNEVIKKRKAAIKNNEVQDINLEEQSQYTIKKKKAAMLDLLISAERDGYINEIGIKEEVDTFMFEGHDTTAAGLTFFLLSIANKPDIQENIVAELRDIFGDTKRAATMQDLNKMHYLDRCIKESLRLYPPVPFISRRISETVKLSNYTIPEGTFCHIHIYDLHRNPDLYENPLEFNPDRFLPEHSENRHNFAYVPFSAGPRNCIGQKFAIMELKSAISAILRNFRVEKITTPSDLVFKADMILRTKEPIFARFFKREDKF